MVLIIAGCVLRIETGNVSESPDFVARVVQINLDGAMSFMGGSSDWDGTSLVSSACLRLFGLGFGIHSRLSEQRSDSDSARTRPGANVWKYLYNTHYHFSLRWMHMHVNLVRRKLYRKVEDRERVWP
jgi:hypothetical protein